MIIASFVMNDVQYRLISENDSLANDYILLISFVFTKKDKESSSFEKWNKFEIFDGIQMPQNASKNIWVAQLKYLFVIILQQ